MSEKKFNIDLELGKNGRVIMAGADPVMDMPWQKADELARALTVMARRAEEYCKANQIIADNALLARAGANIGLSDHPVIKAESVKAALYDRDLRRALSWRKPGISEGLGNIRTRGVVGAPALTHGG